MSKTHADSQIPNLRGAFTVFGGKYRSRQWIGGGRTMLGIAILSCVGGDAGTLLAEASMSSSRLNSDDASAGKSTGAVHWFQELSALGSHVGWARSRLICIRRATGAAVGKAIPSL